MFEGKKRMVMLRILLIDKDCLVREKTWASPGKLRKQFSFDIVEQCTETEKNKLDLLVRMSSGKDLTSARHGRRLTSVSTNELTWKKDISLMNRHSSEQNAWPTSRKAHRASFFLARWKRRSAQVRSLVINTHTHVQTRAVQRRFGTEMNTPNANYRVEQHRGLHLHMFFGSSLLREHLLIDALKFLHWSTLRNLFAFPELIHTIQWWEFEGLADPK